MPLDFFPFITKQYNKTTQIILRSFAFQNLLERLSTLFNKTNNYYVETTELTMMANNHDIIIHLSSDRVIVHIK